MRFVGSTPRDMDDLTKQEERQRLQLFAEDFFTVHRERAWSSRGSPRPFPRSLRARTGRPRPCAPRTRADGRS